MADNAVVGENVAGFSQIFRIPSNSRHCAPAVFCTVSLKSEGGSHEYGR